MGAVTFNAWDNPEMDDLPIQGRSRNTASPFNYRNHDIDKLEPDGLLNVLPGL